MLFKNRLGFVWVMLQPILVNFWHSFRSIWTDFLVGNCRWWQVKPNLVIIIQFLSNFGIVFGQFGRIFLLLIDVDWKWNQIWRSTSNFWSIFVEFANWFWDDFWSHFGWLLIGFLEIFEIVWNRLKLFHFRSILIQLSSNLFKFWSNFQSISIEFWSNFA